MPSGRGGKNVTWKLDDNGTLTISGTGHMESYSYDKKAPWHYLNDSIKKVTIENGVTSIARYGFTGCTSLYIVTIPDSVITIGERAFSDCASLNSITIPNKVTSIGKRAFRDCISLEEVTIPFSVESIGEKVFGGCWSLKEIHYPRRRGFRVYEKNLSQGNRARLIPYTKTPSAVTSNAQFVNKSTPRPVIVSSTQDFDKPKAQVGVTQSNSFALTSEPPLPNFEWTPPPVVEKLRWDIAGNTLYVGGISEIKDCSREEPPWIGSLSKIQKIVISDDVQKIAANAFINCINLEQLTIPYSVRTIGDFAFTFCYCGEQTVNGGKNVIWNLEDGVLMIKKNPAVKPETNFATGFDTWKVVERNIQSVKIERGVIPGKEFFNWLAHVRNGVQVSL